ncbi:Na/Pi cotransporter family protein [Clostridium sp. 19966]|uniref:Na/Pi cotransporter family protein n=1 Tax=Clostridium sp. 19966 TaxID=2768166 RepID=UPI0028E00C3D|nr:Na/Pi cotransporter family protein [Clostridium sp. 19966]MDT8715851.1 Na/Pi cotransporter family protein [Clostridium sp. 19966]
MTSNIFGKSIIDLIGGIGLFLYAVKLMGASLESIIGNRINEIIAKHASNIYKAVLVGFIVAATLQSSSITTVVVIGLVNSEIINLYQAAGIIMGAHIGTTITTQIVAFNIEDISLLFVGVGAFIMVSNLRKNKDIGSALLGFGMMFISMTFMVKGFAPLKGYQVFVEIMEILSNNFLFTLTIGIVLTMVLQNSAIVIAILMAASTTGLFTQDIIIPFVVGCNIGTSATALISSTGTNKNAKITAVLNVTINIIGMIVFIIFRKDFINIATAATSNTMRQIANIHTIFNLFSTILMLPFVKYILKAISCLIKDEEKVNIVEDEYMDERFLDTPSIAVDQMIKETIIMAHKAKKNVEISMEAFVNNDDKLIKDVYENENIINIMEREITQYLVKLSSSKLSKEQINIVTSTFHVVNDIERIGDHAENIAELASEKICRKLYFSEEAIRELSDIYNFTIRALDESIISYETSDEARARKMMFIEEKIDSLEKDLKASHIRRLNEGICTAYSGTIFLDIISNFERIGDHATNISENVIENY